MTSSISIKSPTEIQIMPAQGENIRTFDLETCSDVTVCELFLFIEKIYEPDDSFNTGAEFKMFIDIVDLVMEPIGSNDKNTCKAINVPRYRGALEDFASTVSCKIGCDKKIFVESRHPVPEQSLPVKVYSDYQEARETFGCWRVVRSKKLSKKMVRCKGSVKRYTGAKYSCKKSKKRVKKSRKSLASF
jgi:hypothetical protein